MLHPSFYSSFAYGRVGQTWFQYHISQGYFYLRYLTFCLPSKSRKEQFRPAYCHLLDCFICKYFIRNKNLIQSSRYRDELGSDQIKFFFDILWRKLIWLQKLGKSHWVISLSENNFLVKYLNLGKFDGVSKIPCKSPYAAGKLHRNC